MNHHHLGLSKRRTVMVMVVMVIVVMVMVVMVMHRVMMVMHGVVVVVVCYIMGNISSVSRMLGLMVL